MKEMTSSFGRILLGTKEECYRTAVFLAEGRRGQNPAARSFAWALTGGSTPQDWYRWCVQTDALSPPMRSTAHWFTSDERCVPLASDQSNFGHAERELLGPLGIPAERKHPWPVDLAPAEAAREFVRRTQPLLGPGRGFDVCFLGMGEEGHTASFFPGSSLLANETADFFAAVEVPGKGWRLTITPTGLRACGLIVVMTLGAAKADALWRVHAGPADLLQVPAQVLRSMADRTVWLVDYEAASRLVPQANSS